MPLVSDLHCIDNLLLVLCKIHLKVWGVVTSTVDPIIPFPHESSPWLRKGILTTYSQYCQAPPALSSQASRHTRPWTMAYAASGAFTRTAVRELSFSHTGWLKCYITLFFCWITVISWQKHQQYPTFLHCRGYSKKSNPTELILLGYSECTKKSKKCGLLLVFLSWYNSNPTEKKSDIVLQPPCASRPSKPKAPWLISTTLYKASCCADSSSESTSIISHSFSEG